MAHFFRFSWKATAERSRQLNRAITHHNSDIPNAYTLGNKRCCCIDPAPLVFLQYMCVCFFLSLSDWCVNVSGGVHDVYIVCNSWQSVRKTFPVGQYRHLPIIHYHQFIRFNSSFHSFKKMFTFQLTYFLLFYSRKISFVWPLLDFVFTTFFPPCIN